MCLCGDVKKVLCVHVGSPATLGSPTAANVLQVCSDIAYNEDEVMTSLLRQGQHQVR